MAKRNRRSGGWSKWALSVAAMAGCGSAPPAKPVVDAVDSFNATAGPSVVNAFGETDGAARGGDGLLRTVGDTGYRQHTFADDGYDADVTASPDGKWVCYASTRHGAHAALYLQRTDGTTVTRLTGDDSDNAFPTFSPDGRQIAFCSTRGGGVWNVYTMDAEGRNVTTVTAGGTPCVHPSFSPDGGRVAYSSMGPRSDQWELWTASLTTGERQMIGYGLFPTWSPRRDVDRIAFQRARQRGSRWFSIWTLDLVDGEGRRVTEVAVSSNAALVMPSWSPDGKRLAFATVLDPAKRTRDGRNVPTWGEQDVWTIGADGGDRRRVTDGNGINLSPCWGGDGRIYFVSNRGGTESVWSTRPPADDGTATAKGPAPMKDALGSNDTRDAAR